MKQLIILFTSINAFLFLIPAKSQDFLQYRENQQLTNWMFYKGEIHNAESGGKIDETSWEEVSVPHTWNAHDVFTEGPKHYQGIGWYRTNFKITLNDKNSRYFIRFEGVSIVADVFFNGNYLGTHKGAYSAFIFEITPYIKNNETNILAVRADNSMQIDVAPSGTDLYPLFGGIYRPVTLFGTNNLCISPLDFASSGVYIKPKNINNNSAEIDIEVLLNKKTYPVTITKSAELLPPKGKKGTGLFGQYYTNAEFKNKPVIERIDEEIKYNFRNGSPDKKIGNNYFSMIWTGIFKPEKTGKYTFILRSDDGSRLYINNEKVINNWGNHPATTKTYFLHLKKNEEIEIKIEYYEIEGGASVMFGWQFSEIEKSKTIALIKTEIFDNNNVLIQTSQKEISVFNDSTISETINLTIKNPVLWDAKRNPYLYKLKVTLANNEGKILDQVEQPLGLRYFEVKEDSGLFLNGEYYNLYGVCRHQEWKDKGPALTNKEHKTDFNYIKEMGANGIRLAHYQQANYFYSLADTGGLVIWAEIPNTPKYRGTNAYLQNCKQQVTELVKQNYNHPSILFWGMYNEINIPAEDLKILHNTAKKIDPYRLTTQADFTSVQERHFITDVAAWNWYFGWYYDNWDKYGNWYNQLHIEHPSIKGGLSEFGAGACLIQHETNPERPDPVGKYFPEEYQRKYHEETWRILKGQPDIWCKFIWNMYDFSWTITKRGCIDYTNHKGLITHDRQIKKDAFYFYKANWSNEPVLYIASRRFTERTDSIVDIEVYSNIDDVELYVNDNSIEDKIFDSEINKVIWKKVLLKPGINTIKVTGNKGQEKFEDSCEWNYNKNK